MTAQTPRDWSTISPSAKSLLHVRAESDLPFARAAAALLGGATSREPNEPRRRHFELRARSIDLALDALGADRVIELASGLSFRGLARAERAGVYWLDTDLDAMAALKVDLVAQLNPPPRAGTFRIRALNALADADFAAAVGELPAGPIAVVVEGLLMYLSDSEKAQLAASIHRALVERGGHWITADIYIRTNTTPKRDERTQAFLERHKVEENKFASFDAAEAFFRDHAFRVVQRPSLVADDPWHARETWVLAPG